jgi:ABC-type uncharacterized transport system auxiliary subunit
MLRRQRKMTKILCAVALALTLSGCAIFKTKLVPQAYMPEAPEILMRAPKELHTIKPLPKEEPKK